MNRERCPICGATNLEELLELEDYPFAGNGVVHKKYVNDLAYNTFRVSFCHGCGALFQTEPVSFETMMEMRMRQPDPLPFQDNPVEMFETDRFLQHLKRYAPEGGRALDIGCENGRLLPRLMEMGFEVHGIDADPRAAGLCRRDDMNVHEGRFEEGIYDEESFDMIVCRSVIEHVEEPAQFLNDIDAILKPGGLLAIEVPNINQVFRRNAFGGLSPHYQTCWRVGTLRLAITTVGLDILGGYNDSYVAIFAQKVEEGEDPVEPVPPDDVEEAYELTDAFLNQKDEVADELPDRLEKEMTGSIGVFGAGLPTVDMFYYCGIQDRIKMVATTDKSRHGQILAGTEFEVQPMDALLESDIENVILLSERRQDELLDRLKPFLDRGGRVLRFTPDITIS